MIESHRFSSPFNENQLEQLQAGDIVLLSGTLYTARDAAHKRLVTTIKSSGSKALPFNLEGQTIYYMGPSPNRAESIIGSCGPTTSSRMDSYTPDILACGLRAMIGKGERSNEVRQAIQKYKAIYFITYGGAGALLAKRVLKVDMVAYPDLGAEAILRLEVEDFPLITAYDVHGGDLFTEQITRYRKV